jgi:spermidine synthase
MAKLLPKKPLIFFFIVFILVAAYRLYVPLKDSLLLARNFYGALRVEEIQGKNPIRILHHGKINHGFQYTTAERHLWPTSYYGPDSGVGLVLSRKDSSPQRVGIVGLGIGTLTAYAKPTDYYRLYEINPLILDIAQKEFTFLRDSKAKTNFVLGDGRLSLEKEAPQNFDVLIIDAFSGDAIPRHLLTAEAFALYFRHLKPGGILAIHISNAYLELAPVVKLAADYYKKQAQVVYSNAVPEKGENAAEWVLVGEPSLFENPIIRAAAKPIRMNSDLQMWTDNGSSLYKILKF